MKYPGIPTYCKQYYDKFIDCYKIENNINNDIKSEIRKYDIMSKNDLSALHHCIRNYYGDLLKSIR